MAATDSRNWIAVKGIALASTFAIATNQTSTSLVIIPALLRPLKLNSSPSPSPSAPPSRSSSTLQIPGAAAPLDGRLTPQPATESKPFSFNPGSSSTYKAVAQQFAHFDTANFYASVPLEFFAITIFAVSAYRARSVGNGVWKQWATTAGLVSTIFPYTGALMAPLVHKLKRLGGDEEKVEPYEDAPIDREAEKSNAIEFVSRWGYYNAARSVILFVASGVGLAAFALE